MADRIVKHSVVVFLKKGSHLRVSHGVTTEVDVI